MQIIGDDIYYNGYRVGRIDPEPNTPATVVESFIGPVEYHWPRHYERAENPARTKKRGRR